MQAADGCADLRKGSCAETDFISSPCVFQDAFKKPPIVCVLWGQEGPAALKPYESHTNNAILCLLPPLAPPQKLD